MTQNPAEIVHGPILIGTVFNVLLYGITITQLYLYQNCKQRDRWFVQALVYFLFLGDTTHTISTVLYVYLFLVKHFGDYAHLATADWVFATDPALTGIIGGLVQVFFAWRVKVLTGNKSLISLILFFATTNFLMGIATAIAVGFVPEFVKFRQFEVAVILWLGSACLGDILITVTLVMHLRTQKTGFATTDTQVDRIIRLTVQTGLMTAVVAFIDLMLYLVDRSGAHLILNFPLSKLYTNSLMSSLNARGGWRYETDHNTELLASNRLSTKIEPHAMTDNFGEPSRIEPSKVRDEETPVEL